MHPLQSPRNPRGPEPQSEIWKIRSGHLSVRKALIMGVVNLTPDSFSDGGKYLEADAALRHALEMAAAGADILDLGAESTRPGAESVNEQEELSRLLPVLRAFRKISGIPVSIDTTKAAVAEACLSEGADIINDVSGLRDSGSAMAQVVKRFGAGLVLMHRRGNPKTMQSLAAYSDVVSETVSELQQSFDLALQAGISAEHIAVDPGLGFAKNAEQNLELLAELDAFHALGRPVVLGPSRKSFIGKVTGREANDRAFGTAAVVAYAVSQHIQVIRVHDVGPMKDVITMMEAIQGACHVRS